MYLIYLFTMERLALYKTHVHLARHHILFL